MKQLILDISEFLHFRQVAEFYKIKFTYGLKNGIATVKANATDLALIGY